jgi:hypothetical protein
VGGKGNAQWYEWLKPPSPHDEASGMSDLSNLLGDVYGDANPDAAPVRHEPAAGSRAPEWSSDSQLDKAFSDWVPGQPPSGGDDLTAALTAALSETPAPVAPAPTPMAPAPMAHAPMPSLAHALAEAPSAPRTGAWTSAAPAASPAPAVVHGAPSGGGYWSPGDDDIFPSSRGGKGKKK